MSLQRKGAKQLKRYLGHLGAGWFALLVNLVPLSSDNLLRWSLAFDSWRRNRPHRKVRRYAFNKALVAQWRKAINPLPACMHHNSLEFHVGHVEIKGQSEGRQWRGLLLLIYEYQTNALFHHVTDLKLSEKANPALFWFAVTKAYDMIISSGLYPNLIHVRKKIHVPREDDLVGNAEGQRFYTEAIDLWGKAQASESRKVWLKWRGREVCIEGREWSISRLGKSLMSPQWVPASSSNEFRRQLTTIATQITKLLDKQDATNERITPCWVSLNKARTKEARSNSGAV